MNEDKFTPDDTDDRSKTTHIARLRQRVYSWEDKEAPRQRQGGIFKGRNRGTWIIIIDLIVISAAFFFIVRPRDLSEAIGSRELQTNELHITHSVFYTRGNNIATYLSISNATAEEKELTFESETNICAFALLTNNAPALTSRVRGFVNGMAIPETLRYSLPPETRLSYMCLFTKNRLKTISLSGKFAVRADIYINDVHITNSIEGTAQ